MIMVRKTLICGRVGRSRAFRSRDGYAFPYRFAGDEGLCGFEVAHTIVARAVDDILAEPRCPDRSAPKRERADPVRTIDIGRKLVVPYVIRRTGGLTPAASLQGSDGS